MSFLFDEIRWCPLARLREHAFLLIIKSMKKFLPVFVILAGTFAPTAFAGMFTMWDDNDCCWSDKYYTNHTRFSVSWIEGGWWNFFSFGQEMYAPDHRLDKIPPRDDHPYCGFLYASIGMAGVSEESYISAEYQLGVVGPAAGAHGTQDAYHDLISIENLGGWDTQVENQLGLNILIEAGKRFVLTGKLRESYASDLMVRGFVSLGTVRDLASLGVQYRFGKNLPADLGYRSMRQATSALVVPEESRDFWYAFVDFHLDAVAYDVTMGGEMLHDYDVTDITPYPFSFELSVGFSMMINGRYLISVAEHFRRKDFPDADQLYFAYTGARLSIIF